MLLIKTTAQQWLFCGNFYHYYHSSSCRSREAAAPALSGRRRPPPPPGGARRPRLRLRAGGRRGPRRGGPAASLPFLFKKTPPSLLKKTSFFSLRPEEKAPLQLPCPKQPFSPQAPPIAPNVPLAPSTPSLPAISSPRQSCSHSGRFWGNLDVLRRCLLSGGGRVRLGNGRNLSPAPWRGVGYSPLHTPSPKRGCRLRHRMYFFFFFPVSVCRVVVGK